MKMFLATMAVTAAFAVMTLTTSCSIHHRSGDYACQTNADCADMGRTCDNGFCIVPGTIDAARPDSPKNGGDGGNGCPAGCTTCNVTQKTCTINCMTTSCTNTVTCPAGYKCDIQCNVENACRNGVNCQQATGCIVECSGKSSCQNVECGAGPCDVTCSGVSSCRGVSCNNSCACDVLCTGSQSCGDTIQCTSLACKPATGLGCTSVPSFCHSCP